MGADADLAAVGRDGKDVRGAAEGGDGNPAGVGAEGYVLQTGRQSIRFQVEVISSQQFSP